MWLTAPHFLPSTWPSCLAEALLGGSSAWPPLPFTKKNFDQREPPAVPAPRRATPQSTAGPSAASAVGNRVVAPLLARVRSGDHVSTYGRKHDKVLAVLSLLAAARDSPTRSPAFSGT